MKEEEVRKRRDKEEEERNCEEEIHKKQKENKNNLPCRNQSKKLQVGVIVVDDENWEINVSKKKPNRCYETQVGGGEKDSGGFD
ncbi:unnamed protein product [Camellia sinensis]